MRRLQGLGAVDMRKRCADLRRMAAPGSGASDAERAFALKRLERDCAGIEAEPAPRASRPAPGWNPSWSDLSVPPWQTDKRSRMNDFYYQDFTDLNFAKKAIYEHARAPRVEVSLTGFDGRYGRSSFSAYSSFDDLGYAAMVLEAWGDMKHNGVYEAVIGMVAGEAEVRVLRVRGRDVSAQGILVEHASFNQNPFNDSGFAARLNRAIAKL